MMMMSSDTQDFQDQENTIGKPASLWNSSLGMNSQEKEDSIWKQKPEVSNVWGASLPATGGAWNSKNNDEYAALFQGVASNGASKSESFQNWVNKGEGDKLINTSSFGLSSTSSDLWYPTYDPFKKSWGEVDYASVTSSSSLDIKKVWDSQLHKNSDAIATPVASLNSKQQLSGGNSESEEGIKSDSTCKVESSSVVTSISNHGITKSSSAILSSDNPPNEDVERSQPDGAEGNKEELIARMVNTTDCWGKIKINQETPWQMETHIIGQTHNSLPDANLLMPPGSVIGSDTQKFEMSKLMCNPWSTASLPDHNFLAANNTGNNNWGSTALSPFVNQSSNPAFFGVPANNEWASDDVSHWNGTSQSGCDLTNTNLWAGSSKDGGPMWNNSNMLNPVNNNNSSLWQPDGDKNFWGGGSSVSTGDVGLAGPWQGNSKLAVDKGLSSGGGNVNQSLKSVGVWNESSNNRQMDFGVWNQPRDQMIPQSQNAMQILLDIGLKKEEAVQLLLSGNFSSEKLLELINSAHRSTTSGIEPHRGRMLRGKSVIETSTDYNQTFAGRGASAFQPPQQPFFNNQNLVSQQLQQQMLLQKVGLLGATAGNASAGIQHARSSSMVPKLDSSMFNSGSNNKNQQFQQLQTLLQLQSVLQPLLVERAQLQQNAAIPAPQKKNRLEVLNMDIFKVKALIDQLQLYGHTGAPTSSISSSTLYNQSEPTGVEEARLLQALGQLKLDQISPTSCTSSLLSNSSVTADLVSLLQNTAGATHSINSWLPNMCSGADNFGHGQSKDGWSMLHHGKSSSSFGGMYPPPPPGLNSSDKMSGGFVGQQGTFSRSTSWAPGEKIKTGPHTSTQICWFLIKNTSVMDGSALYACCSQAGSLQQLLSNKLTGHSIACYRDDPAVVQTKLQQLVSLSLECLANKDILPLVDASNSGGTAWVEVTSASGSVAGNGGAANSASGTSASAINE